MIVRTIVAILLGVSVNAPTVVGAQGLDGVDASIGAGSGALRVSTAAWRPLVSVLDRLTLSGGIRFTSYTGDAGTFTNRGSVSTALPTTISLAPNVYGLAVAAAAELDLLAGLSVGFNIDLAGGALGADQFSGPLRATLQRGSLLLGGTPDIGALNSETYVAWRVLPTLSIRGGTTHFVTNFDVTDRVSGASAKYQQFKTVPFVAVRWQY